MCDEAQTPWWSARKQFFDARFDCKTKKTKYSRTQFFAGALQEVEEQQSEKDALETDYLAGGTGWVRKIAELENAIESESGGTLRILVFAQPALQSQMLSVLMIDGFLSIGSLVSVWLYMWYQLESVFLASCGIFEILFSIPVGMTIWAVILQQQVTFLQCLLVYMILGIGADDVFIMYDSWLQSNFVHDDVIGKDRHYLARFAWAYRRSFWAMAVTTATTCGSFIIGCFSRLPSVQAFCIFAAIVVFVDWVFCVTFFASALIVNERHFKGFGCGCRVCGVKVRDAGKCLGPGCCWGLCRCLCSCGGTKWSKCIAEPPAPDMPLQRRPLEEFCSGPLFSFLKGIGGKLCIVFWTLVVISMGLSAGLQLRTAEKAPPFGRDHIDVTKALEILINEYPSFRQPVVHTVFGLDLEEPIADWGASSDSIVERYRSSMASELHTKEGQMKLLQLCRAADAGHPVRCDGNECLIQGKRAAGICPQNDMLWRKHGVYVPEEAMCQNGRYCFMEEFARFITSEEGGCRVAEEQNHCGSPCLWDSLQRVCHSPKTENDYVGLDPAEFVEKLGSVDFTLYMERRKAVLAAIGMYHDHELYPTLSDFSMSPDGKSILSGYIGWNATYKVANSATEANEIHDKWEALLQSNGKNVLQGFQTTELYVYMTTQNEMLQGAISGVALSLVVAYVVMTLATRNWWTATLGLVNLVTIVGVFLGFLPLLGWSLGEYECIFIIATVGLSVDYTVHLLHAYNHSTAQTRHDRSQQALQEMGISVVSSALTTLMAAFVLFFCGIYFFFQFGAFIFLVISLSIVLSLFFLMPVMMLVGPEYEQGKIVLLQRAPQIGCT